MTDQDIAREGLRDTLEALEEQARAARQRRGGDVQVIGRDSQTFQTPYRYREIVLFNSAYWTQALASWDDYRGLPVNLPRTLRWVRV